jgi:hypothetical protein
MLQEIDFERILIDRMIPSDRNTLYGRPTFAREREKECTRKTRQAHKEIERQ